MDCPFDAVVDRKNTCSLKYDGAAKRGKAQDLLPLWVADMDFPAPRAVLDALSARVEHGIFGYSEPGDPYYAAVQDWFSMRFGWTPSRESFVLTPGVVFALAMAVQAYTRPGEAVVIQPPVYYPFAGVVRANGRKLVESPLVYDDARRSYRIDFDGFERAIVENDAKLFLLCSPHNPAGRVWTRAELERLAHICLAHGVTVVSDEIHCDFVFEPHVHTVFSSLSEEAAQCSVVCTAPSKTFNLAGLQVSNIFIQNRQLRKRFVDAIDAAGYSQPNTLGLVGAQAAYEHGAEWLEELKTYLLGNLAAMERIFAQDAPELTVSRLEGTYLPWVDCRKLGLSEGELTSLVEDEAGLWLDIGTMFGDAGAGFIRFNIACPRSVVEQACHRLAAAVAERRTRSRR